ncbi:MAG: lipocalin family protein [Bacteroidales bacterium]|nr:lipocalin family protein [Bacteroidales bacterium]
MKYLIPFLIMQACVCCNFGKSQETETVASVDLEKYLGLWYEIASFPADFQKGCRCTTAEYKRIPGKKTIKVINRCLKIKRNGSKMSVVKGKIFTIKGSNNTRLKVQFLWPFRSEYHIIVLADDYSYAIVVHPSHHYLWILNRDPYMTTDTYSRLMQVIKNKGYDISLLQKTEHNCEGN